MRWCTRPTVLLAGWFALLVSPATAQEPLIVPWSEAAETVICPEPVDSERGFYAAAEAIVLRRRRVDERSFVFGQADNARLLDTTRWTTPSEISGRYTLGRRFGANTAIEVVGFYEDDFQDSTSIVATLGTIRQPFFNHASLGIVVPPIGGNPALVELEYQTQVYSIEANIRQSIDLDFGPVRRLGVMVGPRFVSFEEQFQNFDSATPIRGAAATDSVYETFVYNKLIGGQVGGFLELELSPTFALVSETKWAGFMNVTDATNQLSFLTGPTLFRSTTSEDRFSGLLEFRLHAKWNYSDWLELFAGYTATYMWNMTSAPDVLSFDLLNQSKQNNELAFWIHGPTVGVQIRF